jgi:hypothetical protein
LLTLIDAATPFEVAEVTTPSHKAAIAMGTATGKNLGGEHRWPQRAQTRR